MTTKEAASKLGLSQRAVVALCAARNLAHSRIGVGESRIFISDADLDDYLARTRVEAREPARPVPARRMSGEERLARLSLKDRLRA